MEKNIILYYIILYYIILYYITAAEKIEIEKSRILTIIKGKESRYKSISFPEHARSQVKGGHSSGEIELIQACDWLTADSTLDFQREFYQFLVENLILFTLKSIENN